MTIIKRERRTHGYVAISNEVFEHPGLSWAAKGLLSYLLSTQEPLNIDHLVATFKEDKDTTYRLVNELKSAGYIEEHVTHDEDGAVRCCYTVLEVAIQS